MSNGGMLSQRLACEMANVFKAVVPVAGTDHTESCTPSRPILVIEFHACDDDHVLFSRGGGAGAEGSGLLRQSQGDRFHLGARNMRRWSMRNSCEPAPNRVLERPRACCERYAGCRDAAMLRCCDAAMLARCVTHTDGHSWPHTGRVRLCKAEASQAISANDLMREFFSKL